MAKVGFVGASKKSHHAMFAKVPKKRTLVAVAPVGYTLCAKCREPWRPNILDDCLGCSLANLCPSCMISHICIAESEIPF